MKYTEIYLCVYEIYPKKKGKFEGQKSWNKQKLNSLVDKIRNHIELSIKYDTDWKLGRIPYFSTYLNQRRWEDEISGCYREPETDICVPVNNVFNRKPKQINTLEAIAIKKKMFEIGKIRCISDDDRLIQKDEIKKLQKQLNDLYDDAQKIDNILKKE